MNQKHPFELSEDNITTLYKLLTIRSLSTYSEVITAHFNRSHLLALLFGLISILKSLFSFTICVQF